MLNAHWFDIAVAWKNTELEDKRIVVEFDNFWTQQILSSFADVQCLPGENKIHSTNDLNSMKSWGKRIEVVEFLAKSNNYNLSKCWVKFYFYSTFAWW